MLPPAPHSHALFPVPSSRILGNKEEFAMSVKASVSISEQQDAFARQLVKDGRYADLSAVVERGLELVREETEMAEADLAALKKLLNERMDGEFLSMEESDRQIDAMIEENRKAYGL
jgi:antitoxin ParD1/3/4